VKVNSGRHLDETQIIQAVVDAADLPVAVRDHLAECTHCLENKESFARELANLGQMAEHYAPKPQRRIILPVEEARHTFWSLLNWRNVVAATATVAAVLLIVWGADVMRNLSQPGTQNLSVELLEAERLMTEVNTLVDNALPAFYLELSGEKNPENVEEFYQFLIPSVEKT
jgi:predicted anti-sigma-YlaC factor YlaD